MGACLEEELALDLMAGRLDEEALASVDQHLDGCASCRELVLVLARESSGKVAPHVAGEHLGRYTLVEQLGRGAFGVVWRAHDERLDRDVALKLLKGAAAQLPEHLGEEARAMAKLAHPHVATVFDVGQLESGEPFLAMELLQGDTLRAWLDRQPSRSEILDRLLPVAKGLAAAHRAGLVHRDLKPENVLFDAEGRAKITDFGLASGALPSTELAHASLTHSMVLPGKLIGTPAYMAPEQIRGEIATAQSDQFAFCVMLYEALTGSKPFPAESLEELRERIREPPAPSGLPTKVARALERGLGLMPEQRFADMQALVQALEQRRATPSRGWIGAGALAACALIGWLGWRGFSSNTPEHEPGLGVRAVASEAALPEAVRVLGRDIDRFAAEQSAWSPARVSAAEQLARRAKDTGSDGLQARALEQLARGQWELGQLEQAEQSGLLALGAAQRASDAKQEAQSWLTLAGIATSAGRLEEAERRCKHVENRLSAAKDPLLEASLNNTLGVVLTEAGRYAEAKRALDSSFAARNHMLGGSAPALARVLTNLGNLARARGDYRLALKEHERAQRIDEQRLGKEHPAIARHLHNRARASLLLGEPERARALYEQALEIERKAFGEKHPAVTRSLNSLGLLFAATSRLDRADEYYRKAIASSEGFEGLEGALARYNLALLLLERQAATQALPQLETSGAALEKLLGPSHRRVVAVQVAIGRALIAQNKRESAAFALRRAIKLAEALESPDPELLREAKRWLERAEGRAKEPRAARAAASPSAASPSAASPSAASPSAAAPSPPAVSAAGSYMPGSAFE